jgi:hypothetical protein
VRKRVSRLLLRIVIFRGINMVYNKKLLKLLREYNDLLQKVRIKAAEIEYEIEYNRRRSTK